jgi:hypothetical protein
MVLDQPHGEEVDEHSSCWTYNSFGQPIHTKPRRFVVVRQHLQSCLVVPITTYSGRGVGKDKVKKSDHCIAFSGPQAPPPHRSELPGPGEQGMQPIAIKIDPDDREEKLNPMSRIDFSSPRKVEHYTVVKNYGKINPRSLHALSTQFQNVFVPQRPPRRSIAHAAPVELLSQRTKFLQAYSALVNFGWTHENAVAFVNVNVRASLNASANAAADGTSSDTEPSEEES